MKTIGLLGGMCWKSSIEYYRLLNELINERLGNLHSSKILMYSFDFEEIISLQKSSDWETSAKLLSLKAKSLEAAGAELILICTNTMHIVASEVQSFISVPLVHIADATGEQAQEDNRKKLALLGTKYTMEKDFYKKKLEEEYKIQTLIPNAEEREIINNIIFEEICKGKLLGASEKKITEIIDRLATLGAEGVILGCTELPLLIKESSLPMYDTMRLHAEKAIEMSLIS